MARIDVTYLAVSTHGVLRKATIPKDIMGSRNFPLIDSGVKERKAIDSHICILSSSIKLECYVTQSAIKAYQSLTGMPIRLAVSYSVVQFYQQSKGNIMLRLMFFKVRLSLSSSV